MIRLTALFVCVLPALAETASLRGTVTDPSGAAVPGATVQVGDKRTKTDSVGQYSFPALAAGEYQVRISAKGFSINERKKLRIDRPLVFDTQLAIRGERQVINVDDQNTRITTDPESNGSAFILRERQIAALSDDPDELALQLQALAGPAPGPDGGQTFIDGFSGGSMPPKSAIREVRINSNPFSPEYDRPGFARIDIFTKPGSESFRGQAFMQFNDRVLNSRNPLLSSPDRPPFRTQLYGLDLSGPLRRNKAAFTFAGERRQIDENAFVLATTLDSNLNPAVLNQAFATPQTRTMLRPRVDFALNPKNTLVVRYQNLRVDLENQGVGDFNLSSRAYNEHQIDHIVQVTESAVIGPRAINETRFQFWRSAVRADANSSTPGINVQGAFFGGGPAIGNSARDSNSWELTNISSLVRGRHTFKWGGRARQTLLTDTSMDNFAGTFTFYSLEQYRNTLERQPGAGPSQFSLNAGTAVARARQLDAALFANDDWRVRPNFTVSLGVRYEAQTNFGKLSDWAPRFGIAWGIDGGASRPAKTVLRAGIGTFYDRIPLTVTLNQLRFDGVTQRSFLIVNPTFFSVIPSVAALPIDRQQLRPVSAAIRSPQTYQASAGVDRQLNQSSRLALTWVGTRGVHLLNSRNINAPIAGAYPYGDQSIRLLAESAGFSIQNQLIANASVNYRKVFLFGFYALSHGRDDNEGLPANPYDLHSEWGPSVYGDVRHRLVIGTGIPAPWKFSVNPLIAANSAIPYNVTTGFDPNDTGYPAQRPALASACDPSHAVTACFGSHGTPIGHNYGRGPGAFNIALRLSRTWAFGPERQARASQSGDHGGAPQLGPAAPASGRRYNLTLSASTFNALNHPNFTPPNGNLASPYFGQPRGLGGLIVISHGGAPSTYNRKIDVQLRFAF